MKNVRDIYVSVIDAANRLSVTDSYVRQLLRSGSLSGIKIGERAWLVERKSVELFRKSRVKHEKNAAQRLTV